MLNCGIGIGILYIIVQLLTIYTMDNDSDNMSSWSKSYQRRGGASFKDEEEMFFGKDDADDSPDNNEIFPYKITNCSLLRADQ